jgi:divalent metal cation (Fe/Co/Zn/Cd) transporter
MKSSFAGLMDKANPDTHKKLVEILTRESKKYGLTYHDLRHRNLGDAHRVVVHLVFPAGSSLAQAHREATRIENLIQESLAPRAYVTTHLECASDHDELHPDERAEKAAPASATLSTKPTA